jgi:hypothetical protein
MNDETLAKIEKDPSGDQVPHLVAEIRRLKAAALPEPIPNLMDSEEKWKSQKHELFVLPGTDLSVSVAMVSPNEKYPDVERSFTVYIRKNGQYPNVGYIHLNLDKKTVNWSCDGLRV